MLYFDKLSFSQTISLFRSYQHYVKLGKPTHGAKTEGSLFPEENMPLFQDIDSISMDTASTSEQVVPPSTSLTEDIKHIRFVSLCFFFDSRIVFGRPAMTEQMCF